MSELILYCHTVRTIVGISEPLLLQHSTKHPIKSLAAKLKGRISPGVRGHVSFWVS